MNWVWKSKNAQNLTDAHTCINGLHEALIGGLHQTLGSLIHLTHEKGLVEVSMVTVVKDCDVHCLKKKRKQKHGHEGSSLHITDTPTHHRAHFQIRTIYC